MLQKEEIEKYGGKAAILNHIRDKTDLPIPTYIVKEAGQILDSLIPEFESMKKPVIVRSSSPYEYGDFEGIFESVRYVKDVDSLARAVRSVEASATSDRAKEYAKHNGFKIDGKMHAIIQEQSDSSYCGAMMRHPNNPNWIFITYFSGRGKYTQEYHFSLFDEQNPFENSSCRGFYSGRISRKDTRFLVEQYKKIEGLEEIADDHALFVEFGFKPFVVYQARPFKKKQTADFKVPEGDREKDLWTNFVFGITPPEGIVLPVVRSLGESEAEIVAIDLGRKPLPDGSDVISFSSGEMTELYHNLSNLGMVMRLGGAPGVDDPREMIRKSLRNWHKYAEDHLERTPYCLAISSAKNDEYDTDLSLPNMKSLIIGDTNTFLVHNLIRLFKKADLVLGVGPTLCNIEFYKQLNSLQDKVRIISNGKEGIVIKE